MNMTFCDRVQSMLSHSGLGHEYLAEVMNTVYYLVNRSSSTTIKYKIPFEVWYKSPSDYSQLKVFICSAYAHVNYGIIEPKVKKCIFFRICIWS